MSRSELLEMIVYCVVAISQYAFLVTRIDGNGIASRPSWEFSMRGEKYHFHVEVST